MRLPPRGRDARSSAPDLCRARAHANKSRTVARRRLRHASERASAQPPRNRAFSPARSLTEAASVPPRPCASAYRSSSSRPNSGLLSTHARARSSASSVSASPSAIRSMTAMCSESFSRSAPATGTSAFLSACRIASNNGPRWRTSTMTSPALAHAAHASCGPRSTSPPSVQHFTAFAIRWASLTVGLAIAPRIEWRVPRKNVFLVLGRLFRLPDLDERRGLGANCFVDRILVVAA